jgi:arsenate reductase
MKATIWHNPKCGTSRKVLEALQQRDGVELEVIDYLRQPPSRDKLAQLYRDAKLMPQQGLRLRGTDAQERGLPEADAETVLEAMAADPILIERPLVETGNGVRLCRPAGGDSLACVARGFHGGSIPLALRFRPGCKAFIASA